MNSEAIIESLQVRLDKARYSACLSSSLALAGTALIIVPTSTDRFDMAKALYANAKWHPIGLDDDDDDAAYREWKSTKYWNN